MPQGPIIWQLFLLFINGFPIALTATIIGNADDIKAILKIKIKVNQDMPNIQI